MQTRREVAALDGLEHREDALELLVVGAARDLVVAMAVRRGRDRPAGLPCPLATTSPFRDVFVSRGGWTDLLSAGRERGRPRLHRRARGGLFGRLLLRRPGGVTVIDGHGARVAEGGPRTTRDESPAGLMINAPSWPSPQPARHIFSTRGVAPSPASEGRSDGQPGRMNSRVRLVRMARRGLLTLRAPSVMLARARSAVEDTAATSDRVSRIAAALA